MCIYDASFVLVWTKQKINWIGIVCASVSFLLGCFAFWVQASASRRVYSTAHFVQQWAGPLPLRSASQSSASITRENCALQHFSGLQPLRHCKVHQLLPLQNHIPLQGCVHLYYQDSNLYAVISDQWHVFKATFLCVLCNLATQNTFQSVLKSLLVQSLSSRLIAQTLLWIRASV